MTERAPAVFLDRDGTIIEDVGYPRQPADVRLLPGAAGGLQELSNAGFRLVVISNQSGVGRGLFSSEDLEQTHARLLELLGDHGVELAGTYYCIHAPWEGCICRKPSPQLVLQASTELCLHLDASFLVGDKSSDIEAGRAAGCQPILLAPAGAERGVGTDVLVASRWTEVVQAILGTQATLEPSR